MMFVVLFLKIYSVISSIFSQSILQELLVFERYSVASVMLSVENINQYLESLITVLG